MIGLVGFVVVIGIPVAAVVLALKVADALERRRAVEIARQIAVTDAIHHEFGAVVAPTVRRTRGGWRARGGWRVTLPMDPRHPSAARIVELAVRTLGPTATVEVAVVAPWAAAPRRIAAQNKERIASAMSA